jgi:membrane-bound metal-dependent hydrolase YbcI (DUF457 family)
MDPLTHLAMGAAIANVGFRDRLGRSALWVGAGIAACADLDLLLPRLLSAMGKSVEFGLWTLHRGPTHSLLWATLGGALLGFLWFVGRAFWRQRRDRPFCDRWGAASWMILLGTFAALSHPLLDACTSYGTQLFWQPGELSTRYAWDCIAIVDLFFGGILVWGLLCSMLYRRRSPSEIRRAVIAGALTLILAVGYLGLGVVCRQAAMNEAREVILPNHIERIRAVPSPGSLLLWRVVAKTRPAGTTPHYSGPRNWYLCRVYLLAGKDRPVRITTIPVRSLSAVPPSVRASKAFVVFHWFTGGWMTVNTGRDAQGAWLDCIDLRFSIRAEDPEPLWKIRFRLDDKQALLGWRYVSRHHGANGANRLSQLIYDQINP